MRLRVVAAILCALSVQSAVSAQDTVTYKSAVVGLTDDADLRASFERDLVALARTHSYDVVTTYDIMADARSIDDDAFLSALRERDIQFVLIMRPAAVGEGSSLESVRDEVPARLFASMKNFARRVSDAGSDDLIAVVHLGVYGIKSPKPELISSGAVWLDEPVTDRAEGIRRLQGLILDNIDGVRPAIRRHLGLPPLR
jgi:hypothetical protein